MKPLVVRNIPRVSEAVADVAGNGIIRGTKEYNKDEYITGAVPATSTPLFPAFKDPGKVFYKVRKAALNPWNFKDSADVGTIAVRYIVQPQGEKNSILRIDALYVEDFRRAVHQSNGSVESSEYKDIQDHLGQMELVKKGMMTLAEARGHEDRNVILRAMGTHPELEVSKWASPFPLRPDDRLLLCSDGLYELISDEELASIAAAHEPEDACQRLIDLAKERVCSDNVTSAILHFCATRSEPAS